MSNIQEIWKEAPGYYGYEVSNTGKLRSIPRIKINAKGIHRRLKGMEIGYNCQGYRQALINGDHIKIHRLVAISFIPNPQNKPHINHIDGNKSNNCIENLEWCTPVENAVHSLTTGLATGVKILTQEQVEEIKNLRNNMVGVVSIARKFGVSVTSVCHVLSGKSYRFMGNEGIKKKRFRVKINYVEHGNTL